MVRAVSLGWIQGFLAYPADGPGRQRRLRHQATSPAVHSIIHGKAAWGQARFDLSQGSYCTIASPYSAVDAQRALLCANRKTARGTGYNRLTRNKILEESCP